MSVLRGTRDIKIKWWNKKALFCSLHFHSSKSMEKNFVINWYSLRKKNVIKASHRTIWNMQEYIFSKRKMILIIVIVV